MATIDIQKLADDMIGAVRAHIAGAIGAFSARLTEFETRLQAIPAGPAGPQGERGEAGAPGESIRGEAGPQGLSGDPGPAGRDGADGAPGAPGEAGARGEKGDKGDPGEVGPQGDQGPAGRDGADGAAGARGEIGERGEKGDKGDIGAQGEPGLQGVRGEAGERGERGEPGPAGIDGRDGAPGEPGIRGEVGPVGDRGEKGEPGESIHPDTVALMVRENVDRAVGALPPAKDGAPGRDAAQIDVLPGIDAAKSYTRGTWAKHDGGLFMARTQTEGMEGWECIVAGVTRVDVEMASADMRNFVVTTRMTGGQSRAVEFALPVVIDRGVWRAGQYETGDHVSWGGSGWIAQRITDGEPGEGDSGWRLSTKRGRDGKDAGTGPAAKRAPVRVG